MSLLPCGAIIAAAAATPQEQVLFAANWSAPFNYVTEASLCGPDGRTRVREPSATDDWILESGTIESNYTVPTATASVEPSGLNLTNHGSHLVLWRNQIFPPDSELRFGVLPAHDTHGLNIVFFSASVVNTSGSIFALDQPLRQGNYRQYTRGSIQTYSDSYFRPNGKNGTGICDRTPQGLCAANLRKDPGFHLVAAGIDLVGGKGQRAYEVVVRRQGATIKLLVDGEAEVEWVCLSLPGF